MQDFAGACKSLQDSAGFHKILQDSENLWKSLIATYLRWLTEIGEGDQKWLQELLLISSGT